MSRRSSNRARREAYLANVQGVREYDPADQRSVPTRVHWPMIPPAEEELRQRRRRDAIHLAAWTWVPGMLVRDANGSPPQGVRIFEINDGGNALQEGGWLPDFDDDATVGCLVGLIRRAWGAPAFHMRPSPAEDGQIRWTAYNGAPLERDDGSRIESDDEVDGMLLTLAAAPGG